MSWYTYITEVVLFAVVLLDDGDVQPRQYERDEKMGLRDLLHIPGRQSCKCVSTWNRDVLSLHLNCVFIPTSLRWDWR